MPFNVRLRRALVFADRVEMDGVFVKLGNPGDGSVVFNTELGQFIFAPVGQFINVDDTGLAVGVADTNGLTHDIRFKKFKRLDSADDDPAVP